MWTVVYIAQRKEEVLHIREILRSNSIISRINQAKKRNNEDTGECFEILVPAGELAQAQNLIIDAEL